jgi:antirestriction protein
MTHETIAVAQTHAQRSDTSGDAAGITATLVPDNRRLDFLPLHFGERAMIKFETSVYGWMGNLCPNYNGGYWNYMELSNGGAFMCPSGVDQFEFKVDGNGFDATVSAEVAGIISTAFALNGLLWQGYDSLNEKYEQLLQFISDHPERATIRRALD